LYSGVSGGLAFYVSDTAHFFISPQIAPSRVWDGAWHHVVGSYDGSRVQLWVDGAEVGGGTAAKVDIFYGINSRGVFLGSYRGSCDLGFAGDIDDVRVWNAPPAAPSNPPPAIPPVAGTPTVVPVTGGGTGSGTGGGATPHSSSAPKATSKTACLRVSLNPHTVKIKRKVRVKATVRRASKPASGIRVVVSGAGVKATKARTNKKGTATITVKARKRGRLTVRVVGQKSSCPTSTVRAK
ncbi:MAG TPA: LamG domain-containing protein, partial [Solirubrobacteraceae bacterium]|nr:LamG domain-containing protein [Solirubrobacteraceae bacterium]